MCLSIPTVKRPYRCYVVELPMKYPKISLLILFVGVSTLCTVLLCRVNVLATNGHIIQPLFHYSTPVIELRNGSLTHLWALLEKSSLQFIMYYTHWCAASMKLAFEFHRASKKFQGQVTFIAINCWTGSCWQNSNFNSYPRLFFHHTVYHGVEYKGRHKTVDLVKFVHDAIYPYTYISNYFILQNFIENGKPTLIGFFNGTNYQDSKYNEYFGAALMSINKVPSLQFGVITSPSVASVIGLNTYGQVLLKNPLETPQMYPSVLNFTSKDLLHWAELNKIEYVEELEPDLTKVKQFSAMMKSSPFVLLFLLKKNTNERLLTLFHKVSLSYHNCTCQSSKIEEIPSNDLTTKTDLQHPKRNIPEKDCGELLTKPRVTSCQSFPIALGFRDGKQNVCDVCQECCRKCSCDVNLFPLGLSTSSILRNLPLRNSCRSLRKNYHEGNFLSVCCFQNTLTKFRELALSQSLGSFDGKIQTDLIGNEEFNILAEKLKILKGTMTKAASENDPGILKKLLGKLVKIFKSDIPEILEEPLNDSTAGSEDTSPKSEYHEYGTCEERGKIRVFAGANCYSNQTVKFYYMDSRKYWDYAIALGVEDDLASRTALVIVDVENQVQYVLPEETELTNTTIVDFIMNYTRGNLTRRLRSAPVPTQSCTDDSCIIEVVSLSFDQMVLDPNKDVLLMSYTPWCGFCKSVKPVYVALAEHYKEEKDIRIARINADINDLPWEYTVDSYPTFVFFPARRKDFSITYPDDEELTLKKFIIFLEKHRRRVTRHHNKSMRASRQKFHRLKREIAILRRENSVLKWRLGRRLDRSLEADKKRLNFERRLAAFLNAKFDDTRSQLALEDILDELRRTRQKLQTRQEGIAGMVSEEFQNTEASQN